MTETAEAAAQVLPVDGVERSWLDIYDLTGDTVCANVFHLRGSLDEDRLAAAARALQARHPKLRARVTWRENRRYWSTEEPAVPMPIRYQEVEAGPLPWGEVAYQELKVPLDIYQGIGCRLIVVRNATEGEHALIMVCHHAICMGSSLLNLGHDLLCYYAGDDLAEEKRAPTESLPLISYGQNCFTTQPSPRDFLESLRTARRSFRSRRKATGVRVPLEVGRRAAPDWDPHTFTAEQTFALMRHCRRQKVSPTAVLMAAGLLAQRKLLGQEPMTGVTTCTLDLRSKFEGPRGIVAVEDLANLVTMMRGVYRLGANTDLWELSRRMSADLKEEMDRPVIQRDFRRWKMRRMGRWLLRRRARHPERFARRCPHLDVLQGGVLPFEQQYGELALERCLQMVRQNVASVFLIRIGATTLHWKLTIFLDPVEYVDPEYVKRFRAMLIEDLTAVMDAK